MISTIVLTSTGSDEEGVSSDIYDKENEYVYEYGQDSNILISDIREIIKDIQTKNNVKKKFVFHHFDNASLIVQNSLLKTLEEAPQNIQFILLAKNIHKIIPTIRSRCKIISQTSLDSFNNPNQDVETLLNNVNLKNLQHSLLQPTDKTQAINVLNESIHVLRSKLKTEKASAKRQQYTDLVKYTLKTVSLIENNNLNPQLAIDKWYIQTKKLLQ